MWCACAGAKDNRIAIDMDEPVYLTNAPNFTQLQAVLRGDAAGPEFINGRCGVSRACVLKRTLATDLLPQVRKRSRRCPAKSSLQL